MKEHIYSPVPNKDEVLIWPDIFTDRVEGISILLVCSYPDTPCSDPAR